MNLLTRFALVSVATLAATALFPAWAQTAAPAQSAPSANSSATASATLRQTIESFIPVFSGRVDVRALPLSQAIKTVQGHAQRTVYIVTDPDCKYCKRLEAALSQIKNLTIYRFEYPLTSLHPNAANIAKQIWCAPDRSQAWEAYENRHIAPANTGTCANPIDANIALAARLGIEGTPYIISSDGRMNAGTLSVEALEKFIDGTAG
jgi:hypothetical protein